eukprot:CAMPEP_0198206152 /NCGR_PEP_ID=MMETSP1445-20131203/9689_1 /TAXON_ID=36898 /ORGANISM="Pyramimonas sp., Strain CCMP2087" /LENGTH=245 /DNA_ID=CAMNT_0043878731 /DNA_START=529 /DNA_END=1266 /DNA_ORIENTATION=+
MASLTTEHASECAWYFVVFFVDTTVGVVVALYLHRVVMQAACKRFLTSSGEPRELDPTLKSLPVHVRNWGYAIAQCGNYGDPPSLKVYTPQMVEWVLCVIVGRLACGLMVYSTAGVLGFVARYIDAMFHSLSQNNAEANSAELWAVMVAGPLTMNMIQVLVQDAFLKFKGRPGGDRLPDMNSTLLEPFAHSKHQYSQHTSTHEHLLKDRKDPTKDPKVSSSGPQSSPSLIFTGSNWLKRKLFVSD